MRISKHWVICPLKLWNHQPAWPLIWPTSPWISGWVRCLPGREASSSSGHGRQPWTFLRSANIKMRKFSKTVSNGLKIGYQFKKINIEITWKFDENWGKIGWRLNEDWMVGKCRHSQSPSTQRPTSWAHSWFRFAFHEVDGLLLATIYLQWGKG